MARTSSPATVVRYALFGEELTGEDPEFLHIEEIQTRSRLYAWRIAPHVHRRMFQIVYVIDGPATVRLESQTRAVAGPCVITVPSGAVHSFVFAPETKGYVVSAADTVVLDARFRRARAVFDSLASVPRIVDFSSAPMEAVQLARLMTEMMNEFSGNRAGRLSMLDWMFRIGMMAIARQAHSVEAAVGTRGYARETFQRFVQLVEDKYRARWSVKDYAEALALSPARLNRLCLAFAGKGTQEIIHARLTLEAQRLLTYTSATSAMVAYEIGFQDPAYFTRFFRKRTGKTPSCFRVEAGGKKSATLSWVPADA